MPTMVVLLGVIPAGVPHYEWGEGETVIQLSGIGPLGFAEPTPAR